MAYTVTMTKGNVNKQGGVIYSITVNCVINDGTNDVFDEAITERYNTNTTSLDDFKAAILGELQDRWDKYIAEKGIKDAQAFDDALADMKTQAETYVNA